MSDAKSSSRFEERLAEERLTVSARKEDNRLYEGRPEKRAYN